MPARVGARRRGPTRRGTTTIRAVPPVGAVRRPGLVAGLVAGLLAVVVLVAAGCAGDDRPPVAGGSAGAAVRAYGATVVAPGPTRLLRVDEIRPLIAFGFDIREQPVLDPKTFSLTTLRGPCGAAVSAPFLDLRSAKVFRSTVTLVIEALADIGVDASKAFVDALAADRRDGCPAFEEQIGNGPSSVTYQRPVELPAIGDQRLGWTAKIVGSDGTVGYRTELVVRDHSRVALFVILSAKEVEPAQYGALLQAAADAH